MSVNEGEFPQFRRLILSRTGIDLDLYKKDQILRRLGGMMQRASVSSLADYTSLLQRDQDALHDFVERLTINVTEFYRNPEKFRELQAKVLPELLRERGSLNIWSAGCAVGAEPYTLALMLRELCGEQARRHHILATDVDAGALARAKEALFLADDIRNVPAPLRQTGFQPEGDKFRVSQTVRDMVQFRRQNMLRDPFPSGQDLILCRNVVIYFSEEAKDRLYEQFYKSLRPGGVLFVGSTERINRFREIGFEQFLAFFYRRPKG